MNIWREKILKEIADRQLVSYSKDLESLKKWIESTYHSRSKYWKNYRKTHKDQIEKRRIKNILEKCKNGNLL